MATIFRVYVYRHGRLSSISFPMDKVPRFPCFPPRNTAAKQRYRAPPPSAPFGTSPKHRRATLSAATSKHLRASCPQTPPSTSPQAPAQKVAQPSKPPCLPATLHRRRRRIGIQLRPQLGDLLLHTVQVVCSTVIRCVTAPMRQITIVDDL